MENRAEATARSAKQWKNYPWIETGAPRHRLNRNSGKLKPAFQLAVAGSNDCLAQLRLAAQRAGEQQNLTLPPSPFPAGGNVEDAGHAQ
jgi:hypothetical protein